MSGRVHAVGDIHGHIDKLDRALRLIEADGGDRIVFVGDLVDRGPDSRAVIERLMRGRAEGRDWTVLLGNHDRMFLRFVRGGIAHDPAIASGRGWFDGALGGAATLVSYGVHAQEGSDPAAVARAARAAVPPEHLEWLSGLPLTHEEGDLLFVHAGIRPGVPLAEQAEDDLVWIRREFLDHDGPHGRLVVHGHTPGRGPIHFGNRVAIDGGAAFGRPLVPVAFEGTDAFALGEDGRTPLAPIAGAPGWR